MLHHTKIKISRHSKIFQKMELSSRARKLQILTSTSLFALPPPTRFHSRLKNAPGQQKRYCYCCQKNCTTQKRKRLDKKILCCLQSNICWCSFEYFAMLKYIVHSIFFLPARKKMKMNRRKNSVKMYHFSHNAIKIKIPLKQKKIGENMTKHSFSDCLSGCTRLW